MSLPRYPEYKDSGVAWLAAVPKHWEVHQTKRHFIRKKEVNAGMACANRLALTMNGVVPRSLDDLDGLQSSDYEGYQIFEHGDLAFKLIDLQNVKTSRVGLVPERGIMSPAYIRLQPLKSTDTQFAYWYFMALYWTQVFNALGGGVRQTLGPEELLTVPYPLPPLYEQTAIATFLDRETGKIDALIAEQEKLLTLLAEKRQATISHAVTKGLNPDVPMKDSGVEWLGEVPAHWEIKRLKHIGEAIIGLTYDPSEVVNEGEGTLVLRSSNVQQGRLSFDDNVYVNKAIPKKLTTIVDDILICSRNGSRALIGKNALITEEGAGLSFGAFMTVFRSPINMYLYWVFNSQIFSFQSSSFLTATINQLTTGTLYSFAIPLPPMLEQMAIAEFLAKEIGKINALTTKAERTIELLKERRSALISAAVTGKIDVRNAVTEEVAA